MGIDGSNAIRLVRKNNETAVKEFNELERYLRELFDRVHGAEIKRNDTSKAVELCINMDDRSFFFDRCILETVLQHQPVKCFNDLKWIGKEEKDWDKRKRILCRKYDCWMESLSGYDSLISASQYYVIDNNGTTRVEADCPWDLGLDKERLPVSPSPEEAFDDAIAKGKKMPLRGNATRRVA